MSARPPAEVHRDLSAALERLRAGGNPSPSPSELAREAGCSPHSAAKFLSSGPGPRPAAEPVPEPQPEPVAAEPDEPAEPDPHGQVDEPGSLSAVVAQLRAPAADDAHAVTRGWARGAVAGALESAAEHFAAKSATHGSIGPVTVYLPESTATRTLTGAVHHSFERGLRIARATGLLCLYGPTGGGKTHLAEQIADALGLAYYSYSCTAGMSEAQITGRLGVFPRELRIEPEFWNGEPGGWRVSYGEAADYLPAPFVTAYEGGGLVLLDEFDAMDANARLCVNSALANGRCPVPNRISAPHAERHETFVCVVGVNTLDGPDIAYSGRDPLDLATKDRFAMSKLLVDYDGLLERQLIGESLGELPAVQTPQAPRVRLPGHLSLGSALLKIRSAIAAARIETQALSTRSLLNAAKLRAAGFTDAEVLGVYFTGWPAGDRQKVLDAAGLAS